MNVHLLILLLKMHVCWLRRVELLLRDAQRTGGSLGGARLPELPHPAVFLLCPACCLVLEGGTERQNIDFSLFFYQLKSLPRASLKRTPLGRRRGLGRRSRNPRLSGKRKRRQLPPLPKRRWTNVNRHWLLSRRPRTPLLTCPRGKAGGR